MLDCHKFELPANRETQCRRPITGEKIDPGSIVWLIPSSNGSDLPNIVMTYGGEDNLLQKAEN